MDGAEGVELLALRDQPRPGEQRLAVVAAEEHAEVLDVELVEGQVVDVAGRQADGGQRAAQGVELDLGEAVGDLLADAVDELGVERRRG